VGGEPIPELLLMHGGPGSGKTHLAQAIAAALRRRRSGRRAAYLTAADLVRQLSPYRHHLPEAVEQADIAIVDDVHWYTGRRHSEWEFSWFLDAVLEPGRQVVLTSTLPPADMPALGFELRALLERGALVKLEASDAETAREIARRQAARRPADAPRRRRRGAALLFGERPEVIIPGHAGRAGRVAVRAAEAEGDLDDGFHQLCVFVREVGGGRIEEPQLRGRDVYVAMRAPDDERYILRLRITRYLTAPPRCTFVDARWRRSAAAWPASSPYGPFYAPDFICCAPTAEYHYLHGERVYRYGDGSLVNAVAAVYAALSAPEYGGRNRG
jgi:hypothetical protein